MMEQLTLGQISVAIAFIVAFIGGVKYIITDMKKIMTKALEPTNNKIDSLEKKLTNEIRKSDMNATKNYLVSCIHDIKTNNFDETSKQRFWEQYEHYVNLGGNTYIQKEVDRLRKEGMI